MGTGWGERFLAQEVVIARQRLCETGCSVGSWVIENYKCWLHPGVLDAGVCGQG